MVFHSESIANSGEQKDRSIWVYVLGLEKWVGNSQLSRIRFVSFRNDCSVFPLLLSDGEPQLVPQLLKSPSIKFFRVLI